MPAPQGAAPWRRAEQPWRGADLGVEPDPTPALLGAAARLFPSKKARHSGYTMMGLLSRGSVTPELLWSHIWLLPILLILDYTSFKPLLK